MGRTGTRTREEDPSHHTHILTLVNRYLCTSYVPLNFQVICSKVSMDTWNNMYLQGCRWHGMYKVPKILTSKVKDTYLHLPRYICR